MDFSTLLLSPSSGLDDGVSRGMANPDWLCRPRSVLLLALCRQQKHVCFVLMCGSGEHIRRQLPNFFLCSRQLDRRISTLKCTGHVGLGRRSVVTVPAINILSFLITCPAACPCWGQQQSASMLHLILRIHIYIYIVQNIVKPNSKCQCKSQCK